MVRKLIFIFLIGALTAGSMTTAAQEPFTKAGDWVGRRVVTIDGDTIGEVEDFALDLSTGEIHYVVVSVGSFLIDHSLIAVDHRALSQTVGDEFLTLDADNLAQAKRFSDDAWPERADVLPTAGAEDAAGAAIQDTKPQVKNDRGTAVISSSRRRATLSAGERRIEPIVRPIKASPDYNKGLTPTPMVTTGPLPEFERLDTNKDGALSRREIGARLSLSESYDAIDSDASGRIDRFEFDVFAESRELDKR